MCTYQWGMQSFLLQWRFLLQLRKLALPWVMCILICLSTCNARSLWRCAYIASLMHLVSRHTQISANERKYEIPLPKPKQSKYERTIFRMPSANWKNVIFLGPKALHHLVEVIVDDASNALGRGAFERNRRTRADWKVRSPIQKNI